jgi:branched-subunit amino acid permease
MKKLKEFFCNLTLAQAILIAVVILVLGVSFNINRLINTAHEIACYAHDEMGNLSIDCFALRVAGSWEVSDNRHDVIDKIEDDREKRNETK